MTVLTRRACSSAGALARSVERRLALLDDRPSHGAQPLLPFADMSGDDDEPGAWLGSRGLRDAGEERGMLAGLLDLARTAAVHESKLAWLRRFLRRSREPAIIFTEYRDTLATVSAALARHRRGATARRPDVARAPGGAVAVHGWRRPPASRHRCGQRRPQPSSPMPPRDQPGASLDAGAARPARRTSGSHRAGAHGPRDPPGGGGHLRGVDRRQAGIACRPNQRCAQRGTE